MVCNCTYLQLRFHLCFHEMKWQTKKLTIDSGKEYPLPPLIMRGRVCRKIRRTMNCKQEAQWINDSEEDLLQLDLTYI